MRKIYLLFVLFFIFIFSGQVLAEEDDNKPIIIGLENISRKYEAGTNPEKIDFVKGLELYTNGEILTKEKLLVDYRRVDFNRIGTYPLTYSVLYLGDDFEHQEEIITIEIEIVDTKSPKLEGIKPIIVKVNTKESEIDYLKGVKAYDNDKSSPLNIRVSSYNVELSKIGIYPITYYVQDKTGNETTQGTFVSVVKNIKQSNLNLEISRSQFNIMVNHHDPMPYYKEAISCYDGEIDVTEFVQIIDDNVDYTKLGTYHVVFFINDKYGNIAQQNVLVNIIEDNEPPIFENLGDVYELTINTTNFYDGISAYDEVCGDVTEKIEVDLAKGFRFDIEGEYSATYIVSDYNGNEVTKDVIIKVLDNLPPDIDAPDTLYIKINQPIDIDNRISIIDNIDGVIDNYKLHHNDVNIAKVGTYFIDISAVDSKGNEALKRITVYIYDDQVDNFYEHPIFIGSISGILISSVITTIAYIRIKKKLKST